MSNDSRKLLGPNHVTVITQMGVKIMLKQKKTTCTVLPESVPLCFTAVDIEVCFLFNLESVEPYLLYCIYMINFSFIDMHV